MAQLDRTMTETTIIPPQRATAYLAAMGVRSADIFAAFQAGETAAAALTQDAPARSAGYFRWTMIAQTLRQLFREHGSWSPVERGSRPGVERGGYALTINAGDPTTGLDLPSDLLHQHSPTPPDAGQLDLLDLLDDAPVDDAPPHGEWVLLYHRAADGMASEVSLPTARRDGQVLGWQVRVLLPFYPVQN